MSSAARTRLEISVQDRNTCGMRRLVLDMGEVAARWDPIDEISCLAIEALLISSGVSQFGSIQANFRELQNEFCRPTIDIMLSNHATHTLHARLPFFGRHLERLTDHLRHLSDVVGIDKQCVAQFTAGPGKLA